MLYNRIETPWKEYFRTTTYFAQMGICYWMLGKAAFAYGAVAAGA